MLRACIFSVFSLSILMIANKSNGQQESLVKLTGAYMGQTPPGEIAEPFAPGIISTSGWELEGVFSPNLKEFYYVTRGDNNKGAIVNGFREVNNVWEKYLEFPRNGEVTFSPDGERMHMAKGYKERTKGGWSARKSVGPEIDRSDFGVMRLSVSSAGTYVFDDNRGEVIRISRLLDGNRTEPVELGANINSGRWTAHPFIAPDESYLIWDSERPEGFGSSDLYISFKQQDGSWGRAINMGDKVNSDKWDAYATVTSDGKYILFNRGMDNENSNVDIYWVDAKIINELKTKNGYSEPKSQGDFPRDQVHGISLSAPLVVKLNNQFFRPMTNGLIACSARPKSIFRCLSSR